MKYKYKMNMVNYIYPLWEKNTERKKLVPVANPL